MSLPKRMISVFSAVALLSLLAADALFAQCAMCRTTLEQNGEMAAGFNNGILFLLSMPYLVFGSIALSWYLKRRKAELAQRQASGTPSATTVSGSSL